MATSTWSKAPVADLKKIKGICLDIDETLSTRGKLTAEAFSALWALKKSGYAVVPITGRPAGWCALIARFWPVDAVVGENGAFVFYMQEGVRRRLDTPGGVVGHRVRIEELGREIQKRFPHAKWASDQSYREFDLAIDICEDVEAWKKNDIHALLELCAKSGAHAKLSSVHVNAWFGEYDKQSGFENWLGQGAPGCAQVYPADEWLFIGDSPNDEPMFRAFKNSVGVANIQKYILDLTHPPRWVTESESGAGFSEMALKLIEINGKLKAVGNKRNS